MKPLLVFGASGQAKVVIEAVESRGTHRVIGLLSRQAAEFACAYPVLGRDEDLPSIWKTHGPFEAFIAIGDGKLRREIASLCRRTVPDMKFATVVHPLARLASGVVVEAGAFVAIGATVCADARIGPHALINTNASVDHDCVIGACASIAPGVSLGGGVRVGECAFVGIGASVLQYLGIGEEAIVGGGAVVIRDVPPHVTVTGVPARQKPASA